LGFRINTAIGWGMPMGDFQRLCRIPGLPARPGDEWSEVMEAALAHTSGLKPPRWPLPTTGADDTCFDLIDLIGYDEYSDIILYPSIDEARKWRRRNDDIDYAMLWGPRGPGDHEVPLDRVDYLVTGLHPYGDLRMNRDGSESTRPQDDDQRWSWERDPDLLPGVPMTLRHWTLHSGLLDMEGVARLRPMRATWWS
jgi:hypothetical protein